MRRTVLPLVGIILPIALFLGIDALIAADAPDKVSIYADTIKEKDHKKGPVELTHKKHNVDYKVACEECHHVYEGGKNIWKEGDPVQKCEACHDPVKSVGNQKKLMLAFHGNCHGCHRDLKKAGKPTGPTTKCNDCHAKKN